MLQRYIKEILGKMDASEEQKKLVLDMLQNIKTDGQLFSEFQNLQQLSLDEDEATVLVENENEIATELILEDTIVDSLEETLVDTVVDKTLLDEEERNTVITSNIDDQDETLIDETVSGIDEDTIISTVETGDTFVFDSNEGIPHIDLTNTETVRTIINDNSTVEIDLTLTSFPEETHRNTVRSAQEAKIVSPLEKQQENQSDLGKYLDLGLLGKGGMGEVRKVKDQVLNRNLAMKIVHPSILRSKGALARFIEEAQVGAQLQHPNIVPIHELGRLPDGRYYFTMKEIRGIEFTELITAVHKVSTEQVWKTAPDGTTFRRLIQIFHKMCETMAYAHSLGVIHRDLKPENVMIGGFGEVLVVDWGIAKVLGQIWPDVEDFVRTDRSEEDVLATRMGMVAGTPAYMSPEQANGEIHRISFQSDVYTLGAILYEILAGHPPYTGRTAMEIVEKVRTTEPPSLLTTKGLITDYQNRVDGFEETQGIEEIDTGKFPLPLIQICERAMQRAIKDRYSSAGELAEAVFDWLEGAQKRDKALKEFELGIEKLSEAIEKEAYYEQSWLQANEIIQLDNFENADIWSQWIEASKALKEAQQLRREYRRYLQGALVYDFEMEEANEALAQLALEDIIVALASGEREQREILEGQFQKYLQYLPKRKQDEWNAKLAQKAEDNIQLLRTQRGNLVGRQSQQEDIVGALAGGSRLVSLIGTAGVGKTRLALEVIHDLQEPETKTYFCNLTEANSELGVALFVAKAMGITLRSVDPIGQLGEIFAKNKTILVLDNLEQVVEDVGKVITKWMGQSASLQIIATSRIKLRLEQEHPFFIQPLSLLEGMELFAKRGQQADGRFELNEATRAIVGRLVQQLDSLPLAIELAAARLNIFSVQEVAERLKERFSLLRSREKGTQALQGALDWSWDLLKPWAKAALSQACVFHSGFDVSAAESVLNCSGWKDAPPVFDILQDLLEDSLLLQSKSSEGNIRYGMLESIRQYSRAKLQDEEALEGFSGQKVSLQTEFRHSEYFSQFGKKDYLDSLDNQGNQQSWGAFFEELDNFIAGTEYGSGRTASLCCMAAMKILGMKGPISLGINVVEKVLKKDSLTSRERKQLEILRARFLRISGRMGEARGGRRERRRRGERTLRRKKNDKEEERAKTVLIEPPSGQLEERQELKTQADEFLEKGNLEEAEANYEEALKYYNQALEYYKKIKHIGGIVETYQKIATIFQNQGDHERALKELHYALEIAEEHKLNSLRARLYSSLGAVNGSQARNKEALVFHLKALEINQRLKNRLEEGRSLGNIGSVYYNQGQFIEAEEYYQKALCILQEVGDKKSEGAYFGNLGSTYRELGKTKEAIVHYQAALKIAEEIKARKSEGIYLGNLGNLYQFLGDSEEAISFYQRALEINQEIGNKRGEGINLGNLGRALSSLQKWQEAAEILQTAIKICDVTVPPAGGAFRGVLAWVLAHQEEREKALQMLEKGEELVSVYPLEHGKFLCVKAKIQAMAGQIDEAEKSLYQAKEIAIEIKTSSASELSKALRDAGVFIEQIRNFSEEEIITVISEGESADFAKELFLEAEELLEKGNLEEAESQYKEALDKYSQALEIYQRITDSKGIAKTQELIAVVLWRQGKYDEALGLLEKALMLAEEHDLLMIKGRIFSSFGNIYMIRGESERALDVYYKALEISRELKYRLDEGRNLGNLGVIYQNLALYEKALECLQEAIVICREVGYKRNESVYLGTVGVIYKNLGLYEKSIAHLQRALKISQEIEDTINQGIFLGNLGNAYHRLGQYDESVSCYQQSVLLAQAVGDRVGEGLGLGNLSNILTKQEKWEEAEEQLLPAIEICLELFPRAAGLFLGSLAWIYANRGKRKEAEEALEKGEEIVKGHPSEKGRVFCNKAKVLHLIGESEQAQLALEQAQKIAREINLGQDSELRGEIEEAKAFLETSSQASFQKSSTQEVEGLEDRRIEAEELIEKGNIEEAESFYEEALGHFQEAAGIYQRIGYTKGVVEAFHKIAQVYQAQGEYENALVELNKALQIMEEEPFPQLQAKIFSLFGKVYKDQSKYEKALEFHEKALVVNLRINDRLEEGLTLGYIGLIYKDQGKYKEAIPHFQKALEIAREIENRRAEGNALGNLGNIFIQLERWEEAEKVFPPAIEICETTFPPAAGAFLGSLAWAQAQQKRQMEAHESLEKGEPLVSVYALEYGKFLCKKAKIYQLAGEHREANEWLLQAQEIGEKLKATENSDLGKEIRATEEFLEKPLHPRVGKEAETFVVETEDVRLSAEELLEKGNVEEAEGFYKEAFDYFDEALKIFILIGNLQGVVKAHQKLAIVLQHQGEQEKALVQLKQGLEIAEENGFQGLKAKIYSSLGLLHHEMFKNEQAILYLHQALEINRVLKNRFQEGGNLGNLGTAYIALCQYEQAIVHLEQAIGIAREIENKRVEEQSLGDLGLVYNELGQYDKALLYYQQAFQLAQEIGDQRTQAITLGNLGSVYSNLGENEKAIAYFEQGIQRTKDLGMRRTEGLLCGNLGLLYLRVEQWEKAKEKLIIAIEICDEIVPPAAGAFRGALAWVLANQNEHLRALQELEKGEGLVAVYPLEYGKFLCKKAKVYQLVGKHQEANKWLLQAQEIGERLKTTENSDFVKELKEAQNYLSEKSQKRVKQDKNEDLRLEAEELLEKGRLEEAESFYEEALQYYQRSLHIYQQIDDIAGFVEVSHSIAVAYQYQGKKEDTERSLSSLLEILEIAEKNDLSASRAKIYASLGMIYLSQADYSQALAHYYKALEINRELKNRLGESGNLGSIGIIFKNQCKHEEAIAQLQEAAKITKEIGDKQSEAIHVGNIAVVYLNQGLYEVAIPYFERASSIARSIRDKRTEGITLGNLGVCYQNLQRYEEAQACFVQVIENAREIGDQVTEGIFTGNLGDILLKCNRIEEARETLLRAIDICVVTMPAAAGAFRGSLALLHAQENEIQKALDILEEGEALVATYPLEYGKFLCKKARVYQLGQDVEKAKKALTQAEHIAKEAQLADDSELGKEISIIRELLEMNTLVSGRETEDLRLKADELIEKGNLEKAESFYDRALEYYQQALGIYKKIQDIQGIVEAHRSIASILREKGSYEEALAETRKALRLAEENDFTAAKSSLYSTLGTIYYLQPDCEQALIFFKKALEMNKKTNDQMKMLSNLGCIGNVFSHLERYEEAISYYQEALALSQIVGDKRSEGMQLGNIGTTFHRIGQPEKAASYYKRGIKIAREIGNKKSEGITLGNLGIIYVGQGKYQDAIDCYKQGIEIAREIGNKNSEAIRLGNLANLYQKSKRMDEALSAYQQALALAQENKNQRNEGIVLGNLGSTLHKMGRNEEAKEKLLQSIALCQSIQLPAYGSFQGILAKIYAEEGKTREAIDLLEEAEPVAAARPVAYGEFLCKKARVFHIANKSEEAKKAINQAKKIAGDIQEPEDSSFSNEIREAEEFLTEKWNGHSQDIEELRLEADELMEKGNLEELESFYETALEYYKQALEIYQKIEDKRGETAALYRIGLVFQEKGYYEQALGELKQALQIAEENGFQKVKTKIFTVFGAVHQEKGQYELAMEYHHKALALNRKLGDTYGEGVNFGNLALICRHLGRYEQSIQYFERAIEIAREIGNKRNEGTNLGNLANLYRNLGRFEEALASLQAALTIARDIGETKSEGSLLGNLGVIYTNLERKEEAIPYFQRAIEIAREIGDKRNEGIHLGNLSNTLILLERWKEAEEMLLLSIAICAELVPPAAGAFFGLLGWCYINQGEEEKALEALKEGEPLTSVFPMLNGVFLCQKAKIYQLIHQPDLASKALGEAEKIASKIGAKEQSDLGKAIKDAKLLGVE